MGTMISSPAGTTTTVGISNFPRTLGLVHDDPPLCHVVPKTQQDSAQGLGDQGLGPSGGEPHGRNGRQCRRKYAVIEYLFIQEIVGDRVDQNENVLQQYTCQAPFWPGMQSRFDAHIILHTRIIFPVRVVLSPTKVTCKNL